MNSKPPTDWEEVHNGLVIFLTACMFILVLVLVAASGCEVRAQDKPAKLPMPPDLLHVSTRGCYIEGRATDPPQITLDAKTGEEHEARIWTVTPFAKYQKLPDGTKRDEWQADKWIFSVVGTEAHIPAEATDVCSAWMKALDKVRQDEAHKAGH